MDSLAIGIGFLCIVLIAISIGTGHDIFARVSGAVAISSLILIPAFDIDMHRLRNMFKKRSRQSTYIVDNDLP